MCLTQLTHMYTTTHSWQPICVCHTTHSYVHHDSFNKRRCAHRVAVAALNMSQTTHSCVTQLIHMYTTTHSTNAGAPMELQLQPQLPVYVCHDTIICVPWRIHVCALTRSCVLQCVAVCCSVLQCVAACCSVLQCVAVSCSVLQCVAVCCSMLQYVAVCCSVLQCVAVCCSVLQCVPWRVHMCAMTRSTNAGAPMVLLQ